MVGRCTKLNRNKFGRKPDDESKLEAEKNRDAYVLKSGSAGDAGGRRMLVVAGAVARPTSCARQDRAALRHQQMPGNQRRALQMSRRRQANLQPGLQRPGGMRPHRTEGQRLRAEWFWRQLVSGCSPKRIPMRTLVTVTLGVVLLSSSLARAQQGAVLQLSPQDQQNITAQLGAGVVGAALPSQTITDPSVYFPLTQRS